MFHYDCCLSFSQQKTSRKEIFHVFVYFHHDFQWWYDSYLYLIIRYLHMIDTIWALVIPGAISVYKLMIARTFVQSSIPQELYEAAELDGCSDTRYFFSMVLPLSKVIIAVLVLFYAIGHWNAYFNAFLYLNDRSKFPAADSS